MSEPELKLNSLSRYSKDSPRLVREEYGHCEVPAGCGGAVLRWRDPDAGVPVPVKLYTAGRGETYLDGAPLTAGRPLISFGDHQLAFEISGLDFRYLVLSFAAVYRETEEDGIQRSRLTGEQVTVLSAPDGTWKYSTEPPGDPRWRELEFDDSAWRSMVEKTARPQPADPEAYDPDRWRIEWTTDLGAVPLGIPLPPPAAWERLKLFGEGEAPPAVSKLWVRKRFTITRREGNGDA
ncbi:MAG: hypothetical protein ACK47B_10300 [Armatimonadota bacterium]